MNNISTDIAKVLPSTAVVTPAANEGTFALVPEFCLTAPALRETVDQIADHAMTGLERVAQAVATAPAEMQPLLADLRALFGSIGHAADSTADDVGSDLNEVWGLLRAAT